MLNQPVFIIGGSRTGSEMLKTMLSASRELNFTDELYVLCPRWLHKDLRAHLRDHVGDLTASTALDDVISLIFSRKLFGWTWQHACKELDQNHLRTELLKKPLTIESILTAVLRVNATLRNKPRQGAKFPVHYSYALQLMKWYPNCRVIHTTRDPRAVYASQANKYLKPGDRFIKRVLLKSRQFLHINIQVAWTAEIHRQMQALPNYRLVRYEDVVSHPQEALKELCGFLNVKYVSEMLEPRARGSSYGSVRGQKGVNPRSLEAWRNQISPLTAAAICALQARAARILGY